MFAWEPKNAETRIFYVLMAQTANFCILKMRDPCYN